MEEHEHYQAQGEIQRQASETQNMPMAPQMMEQVQQSQAVLVEQTNPNKIVEAIMLRLRGRRKMDDGTEEEMGKPKMNEKGVEAMWFILDSHINQNIILSRLEPEQIGKIMDYLQMDLVDKLSLNMKEYGITDKTDLDDINNSVLVNIFMALKRAEGQNEKNWLSKISVEQITNAPRMPGKKSEGFWSKFKI